MGPNRQHQIQHGQPLAEVFGYLINDQSPEAYRHRSQRLCPFNNRVPNCTKDKASNPLGVCSIYHEDKPVITCPIRFRQNWATTIIEDAKSFFFAERTEGIIHLTEVRLKDAEGKIAGNIDIALVCYRQINRGRRRVEVIDFGGIEIQAVYISGNVRKPFNHYMENPLNNASMTWPIDENYPRPDYLSSSRKRLAPQLIYKGGILHSWGKKIAVVLQKSFFDTLPSLPEVDKSCADVVWLIYDLELDQIQQHGSQFNRYRLTKVGEVFTKFEPALDSIMTPSPGKVKRFEESLRRKIGKRLRNTSRS